MAIVDVGVLLVHSNHCLFNKWLLMDVHLTPYIFIPMYYIETRHSDAMQHSLHSAIQL